MVYEELVARPVLQESHGKPYFSNIQDKCHVPLKNGNDIHGEYQLAFVEGSP